MSQLIDFLPRDAQMAQRWHARITHASVLRTVLVIALSLAVISQIQKLVDARERRARLLERGEELRSQMPDAVATLDAFDAAVSELAREPFGPELRAPADFTRPGLYLRAVIDEVGTGREIHHAARASRKDVLLACLLRPPTDASSVALHRAAIRYRWRVELDELSPRLFDFEALAPAIPASRSFLDEVRATHDPTTLRLFELEAAPSRPISRSDFAFGIIALDELPTGFPERGGPSLADVVRSSQLDEIARVPHTMRVGVVELPAGRLVSKVRVAVDARDLGIPHAMADAEEIHACQAAVALAGTPH
ncbi:MAG: hypothetical protein ACXVEE_31995 [Polyangiales bacterium]